VKPDINWVKAQNKEDASKATFPSPVVVAVCVAVIGGFGNVAFSLHNGSQLGFAFVRFFAGLVLVSLWVAVVRPVAPTLRTVRRGRVVLHATAALDAAAVLLLIMSAGHVDTLVFTVVGMVAPATVALGALILRLPQPSLFAGISAVVCVVAAGLFVLSAAPTGGGNETVGVVLAVVSMLCGAGSVLLGVYAASVYPAIQVARAVCGWGVIFAGIAVVVGVEAFDVRWSTVIAACFVAVVPGGVAKAGAMWAYARTAPALVSSLGSVAVLTAGVGAWLLLDQTPTAIQILLAVVVVVAAAVTVMKARR
jgi:drug/metabolite transporter (DMT)-like permease